MEETCRLEDHMETLPTHPKSSCMGTCGAAQSLLRTNAQRHENFQKQPLPDFMRKKSKKVFNISITHYQKIRTKILMSVYPDETTWNRRIVYRIFSSLNQSVYKSDLDGNSLQMFNYIRDPRNRIFTSTRSRKIRGKIDNPKNK